MARIVKEGSRPTVETRQSWASGEPAGVICHTKGIFESFPMISKELRFVSEIDRRWQEKKSAFFDGLSGRNPQKFPQEISTLPENFGPQAGFA